MTFFEKCICLDHATLKQEENNEYSNLNPNKKFAGVSRQNNGIYRENSGENEREIGGNRVCLRGLWGRFNEQLSRQRGETMD